MMLGGRRVLFPTRQTPIVAAPGAHQPAEWTKFILVFTQNLDLILPAQKNAPLGYAYWRARGLSIHLK